MKNQDQVPADAVWFVVNHDRNNHKLRGPYAREVTAGAVRAEMERNPDENRNLWVVWEKPNHPRHEHGDS